MNPAKITPSLRVRSLENLGPKDIFGGVDPRHIENRVPSKVGHVIMDVPGYGREVFWVKQVNGIAVYCFTELEPY